MGVCYSKVIPVDSHAVNSVHRSPLEATQHGANLRMTVWQPADRISQAIEPTANSLFPIPEDTEEGGVVLHSEVVNFF